MRITGGKKNKVSSLKENNRRNYSGNSQGKLRIVGIGPGDLNHLSQKALDAVKDSQIIIGYKTYIKLLNHLVRHKEVLSSPMTQEVERVSLALNKASQGKRVCLVSSGDPGVYGMAGLALELLKSDQKEKIKIEIIPGITSANSCASVLGAPLMHDFAVISLSDLLTEKKTIEKRVALAAQGDFVIVFYNPQSNKRTEPLRNAWNILMKHRSPKTPVGIVRNGCRDDEETVITELKKMLLHKIDMKTTIIVGNSETYIKNGYMITPRGYKIAKG